jgi:lipopolysaccharide/colanic/teichoic acid biosynthesis glycosyltransferase
MLAARGHLGIKIVGWVGDNESDMSDQIPLPKLGALRDLSRVLQEHLLSQVVVSQHSFPPEEGRAIAQCAEEAACRVRFFAHVQRYFPSESVSVEHEGQFTFVTQASEPLENPVNRLSKRLLDISVSLPVVLFVLPPLTLFVWFMQRRQSAGPVVHRQYRSGINRKKFLIYKYRTMHVANNAAALTKQAQANDSRIFSFGRFLRRTSLDEFPQFLNVLMGDMSVSGPRPHLLEHDEQFAKIVNSYYTRHFVKPGITGLAQTRGYRGEISEPSLLHKRIGYDMIYIRRWTLSLDLQILFQTVSQVVFPPRSAY